VSPGDPSKLIDERRLRDERSRGLRVVGALDEPTSFVQVEATLLEDLRGYQEDLWDYVEGLMVTSESTARGQRLLVLIRQRKDIETDAYWDGIDNSLLEMSPLLDSMSPSLRSLLGEDSKLADTFDEALTQATNGVQEARNNFPLSSEELQRIGASVLASATRMSQASSRLARLCKNGAQDQAEGARLCVNRIIAQVRSATAAPLVDAALKASKAPPPEQAGLGLSDPRGDALEEAAGADPEASRHRDASSAPGKSAEVEAHLLNPQARDWRASDDG
jgi:hypothetical protein